MKRHYFTQRQQTRRFLTGTLFALSVLATGGPASALDGKTLPGSACEPTDQSQPYFEDGFGRIFNPSATQTLGVNCPVVRDIIAGRSNGINQAVVKVIDQNPNSGQEVRCTLTSLRGDTGQLVASISRNTTGSDANIQTLTFGNLASTSGGYYILFCNIPPRTSSIAPMSGIVMYQVDETD